MKSDYVANDFSVAIEQGFRELIRVVYQRAGSTLRLDGEHMSRLVPGQPTEGLYVQIPPSVAVEHLPQMIKDLEEALSALGYGYVIKRDTGIETVSETDRHRAIAELHEMGYQVEIMPDHSIQQTRLPGASMPDAEAIRKQLPRMMALIQTVHASLHRFEVLAKTEGFEF
jgi:hypothetical protein